MYTQEQYNKLIDLLLKHELQYYSSELSDLTDAEFDSLYFEAEHIEQLHRNWIRDDSPTKRIMGFIDKNNDIKHKVPLLSLSKAMDFNELKKWLISLKNIGINSFFIEPYNGFDNLIIY